MRSFSVLLAQDLAVIPILLFVPIVTAQSGRSVFGSLASALLQAAMALLVIVLFGRVLLRPLFRLVATARSTELFIAAVLFVIIAAGVIAEQAHLSMALGAFVAGLLLAETEYRKAIEATVAPFKGLLLGIFFFTVGMNIDFRELIREPLLLLGGVVGLIALKAFVLTGLGRLFRLSWPVATETGLLLGPGGEFAFVGIGMAGVAGSSSLTLPVWRCGDFSHDGADTAAFDWRAASRTATNLVQSRRSGACGATGGRTAACDRGRLWARR